MRFKGNDGGSTITALALDYVTAGGNATFAGDLTISKSTPKLIFDNLAGGGLDPSLTASGTNFTLSTSSITPLSIALDTGNATFAGTIDMSANKIIDLAPGSANTDAVNFQQLNDATTGVLVYQGVWNASTNSPTLASGVGTPGYYYIVDTDGSTNLDGITDWKVGDWAVFSDLATDAWQKIDNTSILGGAGTGGTLPIWSGTGTSLTLADSRFKQVATANRIVGPGNTGTDYSLEVQNAATTNSLTISGTGVVTIPQNYLHVTAAAGVYVDGIIKARGGVMKDNGPLSLGGNNVVGNLILTSNTLATFAGNVSLTGGSLSISGDGSNAVTFTESGNGDFTIDAPDDIRLDAGGGDIVLRTGGTEFGRISSFSNALRLSSSVANEDILLMPNGTGNVGIGTTSPALQSAGTGLHINATTSSELKFTNNTTGSSAADGTALVATSNNFTINNRETGYISLGTSNSVRMHIEAGGNVGIGTTNPNARLTVWDANQTFDVRTSGINVHRPNSYGQYGSVSYDGSTLYGKTLASTYSGNGALGYGTFAIQQYNNGSVGRNALEIGTDGDFLFNQYAAT